MGEEVREGQVEDKQHEEEKGKTNNEVITGNGTTEKRNFREATQVLQDSVSSVETGERARS